MKKRAAALILAVVLACSLIPAATALAGEQLPYISDNAYDNNYSTWARTVRSYLFENGSGGLTRVEYVSDGAELLSAKVQYADGVDPEAGTPCVVVEDYSSEFELLSSRILPAELSIWGGFYAGEDYNFLIFGQDNVEENDSGEVVRIVKYSRDWERLGSAGLYGANTIHPFDAGSLRCGEYGDTLYIRTCHEMYTSADGLNHQANLTIALDEDDMAVLDSYYGVLNPRYGYVSHSFNQFVIIDSEGRIVTADHGDAYPRSICLMVYQSGAGEGKFSGMVDQVDICEFPGAIGANATGASLGGLAETGTGYVVSFNYDGKGSGSGSADRGVYLGYVEKTGLSKKLRRVSPDSGALTPVLAPTGPDGGFIMWNTVDENGRADGGMSYVRYSADGSLGELMTTSAALSDCQPILYNGNIVWYATDGTSLCFYVLDSGGNVETHGFIGFEDVEPSDYFYEPVRWALENGITNGDGSPTTFNPNGQCTRAQVLTFLYRAAGSGRRITITPRPYNDVAESDYFYYPVNWAYSEGIITLAGAYLEPAKLCPRSEIVQYMWRSAKCPEPTADNPFTDISPSDDFYKAALWAYETGITQGTGGGLFSPGSTCTRAQVVTFLQRFVEWENK